MGNPTECGIGGQDYKPVLVVTAETEVAVTLDPDKTYTLLHLGVDGTGAGSADTSLVYLSFNTTAAVATTAGSSNKGALPSLEQITIGPGLTEVSTITAAAANTPAIMIIPNRSLHGSW